MPTIPELLEIDFVAQFRFPTPAAYACRRVSVSDSVLERRQAIAWAAEMIGRVAGSIVQADRHAEKGGAAIPATSEALRWTPVDDPFLRELKLPWLGARGLLRLAEETDRDDDVEELLHRLRFLAKQLDLLARYRLVVLVRTRGDRTQGWVFLGPQNAIPVWLRGVASLPQGVPLLMDPRDGRYLTLEPYLRYVDRPRRLDLLMDTETNQARYMAHDGSVAYLEPLRKDLQPVRGQVTLDERDAHLLTDPTCVLDDGIDFAKEFQIIGWMARGGVAEIYLARRLRDGHLSAIKLFVSEDSRFDRNLMRFIDEGTFRDRIHCDKVIRYDSRGVAGNHRYLEMEYLPGGDLEEQLRRSGPLPPSRALTIAHEVIDALEAIHGAGIVHRDIKPGNVMFTWERAGRLIDLGIARNMDPAERKGATSTGRLGTEGYMAPEQAQGGRVDERTDVYGVGVLLHEMITGIRPDQLEGAGPHPVLPRGLETLIARCLLYRPASRYPSMTALRGALQDWAAEWLQAGDPVALSLDLEGTIITNALEAQPRPGLAEFMDWCHRRFHRLFVYTCVDRRVTQEILSRLVYEGDLDHDVADRLEYVEWSRGYDGARKDLRRCAVPVENNVILDDHALWIVPDQRHRWVQAPDYNEPDPTDRFLRVAPDRIEQVLGGASSDVCGERFRRHGRTIVK